MDYRPVPDDHRDAYDAVLSYAFSPERGPDPDRDGPDRPAGFHPRALYDVDPDGDRRGTAEEPDDRGDAATEPDERGTSDPPADAMAVVCGFHDFSARIRGAFRPVGGVSAVASPPERRRQGLVRELLGGVHRELRDDGVPFAALWPFEFEFYRRLGYARVGDYSRITVPPDELAAVAAEPAGRFEQLSADDWARLDAVHAAWADDALGLDRTEDWWRKRVFRSWGTDPYVYGWSDGGELRGYLVYTVEEGDDEGANAAGRTMAVSELAHRDREARGQLLRFCRDHDSQVEAVRLVGPPDARLFDELDDPRAADTEVRPGPMARLVDVPAALEAVDYPAGVSGSVVLDVADDGCPWNDGRVRLSVGDGGGRVESVDDDGGSADVSLDVRALTRLVVGSHGIDRLVELGDVSVADPAARDLLADALPPTDPYLREGF